MLEVCCQCESRLFACFAAKTRRAAPESFWRRRSGDDGLGTGVVCAARLFAAAGRELGFRACGRGQRAPPFGIPQPLKRLAKLLTARLRTCIHNRGMSAGRGILPPIEANFFGGLTPGGKI